MKKFTLQFIKYFGVAGIGYVVDFGTMILCKELFHLHYLVSATLGFILGLVVVYILSNRYVFGKSKLSSRRNEFIVFCSDWSCWVGNSKLANVGTDWRVTR